MFKFMSFGALAGSVAAMGLAGCSGYRESNFGSRSANNPPGAYLVPARSAPPYDPTYAPPPRNGFGPPTTRISPPSPGSSAYSSPGVRLLSPEGTPDDGVRQAIRLGLPQSPEPPLASKLPNDKDREDKASSTVPLPAGITQFSLAKEKVASGLKPSPEGLDWLKTNGYKTVLHLRAPDQDDTADRDRIETQRDLKYVSLDVSPETLSKEVVEKFNLLVADESNRPLFVYADDGAVAGGLWYLHFLQMEKRPDASARKEAGRLGLKDDPAGDQGTMWVAIQKYLESQKP